jgi:hypothetical protein
VVKPHLHGDSQRPTTDRPTEGALLIRVTIIDAQQTISFMTSQDSLMRLVAGCSANPGDAAELLIATDLYQHGIASAVMAGLMEFDKMVQRQGPGSFLEALEQAKQQQQPFAMTFQVIDQASQEEALQPRACDLAIIDLTSCKIRTTPNSEIPTSGEVRIHTGQTLTEKHVTYILPQQWKVESL